MNSQEEISDDFGKCFGIRFEALRGLQDGHPVLDLRPSEPKSPHAFAIRFRQGWKSIAAEFMPDSFAGPLIRAMGEAAPDKRVVYATFARVLRKESTRVRVAINGAELPADQEELPPGLWTRLEVRADKLGLDFDLPGLAQFDALTLSWGRSFVGMVVALLPLEEQAVEESPEARGLPEGALRRVEVNRYERSPINRQACIADKGDACAVCGLQFESVYGRIGDGYIHVHHVTPVSVIGANYVVDPVNDLVPVCPNCHAMLHRRDPPLTVDELRAAIRARAGKSDGPGLT
jgi:5-methylcytosine-specific restriction enzyme A